MQRAIKDLKSGKTSGSDMSRSSFCDKTDFVFVNLQIILQADLLFIKPWFNLWKHHYNYPKMINTFPLFTAYCTEKYLKVRLSLQSPVEQPHGEQFYLF